MKRRPLKSRLRPDSAGTSAGDWLEVCWSAGNPPQNRRLRSELTPSYVKGKVSILLNIPSSSTILLHASVIIFSSFSWKIAQLRWLPWMYLIELESILDLKKKIVLIMMIIIRLFFLRLNTPFCWTRQKNQYSSLHNMILQILFCLFWEVFHVHQSGIACLQGDGKPFFRADFLKKPLFLRGIRDFWRIKKLHLMIFGVLLLLWRDVGYRVSSWCARRWTWEELGSFFSTFTLACELELKTRFFCFLMSRRHQTIISCRSDI